MHYQEKSNKKLCILCVVKHEHEMAWQTASLIEKELISQSIEYDFLSVREDAIKLTQAAKKSHAVLVIGGDGTMLGVARALHDLSLPMFGINFGRVGFLMEAKPNNWDYWLKRFIATVKEIAFNIQADDGERLLLEEHSLFHCTVQRGHEQIFEGFAFNDAVIARGNVVRAVALSLYINNNLLSDLRCDGLIISTPIGATAYAISAHGPLALPGLDALIITPICPFAGAFPPCVVSGSSLVTVGIEDVNTPAVLTLDGQESFNLLAHDIVHITTYQKKIPLLVSDSSWYVKRLGERGYIKPGPGMQLTHHKENI